MGEIEAHHPWLRAAGVDGHDRRVAGKSGLQHQQQLLAFSVSLYRVELFYVVELADHQRDVGHGGELQHKGDTPLQDRVLQAQYVRSAVFGHENLPSSLPAPGRVDVDEVRPETVQQPRKRGGIYAEPAEADVVPSEKREIPLRGRNQKGIHFVVEDLARHG